MTQSLASPHVRFVAALECADPALISALARRLDLELGFEACLDFPQGRLLSLANPRDPLRMSHLREHFDRVEELYATNSNPIKIHLACVDSYKTLLAETRETPWSIYIGKGVWARIALTRPAPDAVFTPFQIAPGLWGSTHALAFISAPERLAPPEA